MRSVDKGINPVPYRNYRDALPYLVDRLGWYCSYCEMVINNEPDVEHVQPKSRGGHAFLLENFLLGCKKCNDIKSNKNPNRANHLWPDEDNTSVAYEYYNEIFVRPIDTLPAGISTYADNTLTLTGIDRVPKHIVNPTKKEKRDPRWQRRKAAWGQADLASKRWRRNPSIELCEQIADSSAAIGFYSIWCQFFSDTTEAQVLHEIKQRFLNTYEPVQNGSGEFVVRSANSRF